MTNTLNYYTKPTKEQRVNSARIKIESKGNKIIKFNLNKMKVHFLTPTNNKKVESI